MPWPLPWNSFDIVLLRFCAFAAFNRMPPERWGAVVAVSGMWKPRKFGPVFFRIFSICDVNSNSRDDAEIFFTSLR